MIREQAPDERIREWLHDEAAGQLPYWVLTTTFERTRAQHQRRSLPGWRFLMTLALRRPATAPQLRAPWVLILTAILALALSGSALVLGSRLLQAIPPDNGPLAVAMPPTACPPGTVLHSGDIATIAGNGILANTGDGGPAIVASLWPNDWGTVTTDASGAFYFSQEGTSIRRIGTDGVITTFSAPATGPPFVNPTGLNFDAAGNLFVADTGAGRIWKLDPTGIVTPVAGNGRVGSSGDGGPAITAEINALGVVVGPRGDLYLDDTVKWRTVDSSGMINTFAGTGTPGYAGDDGPAVSAKFGGQDLGALGVDRFGNVYLGDDRNFRLRKVDPAGIITTVAGTGSSGNSGDGALATDANIWSARAAAADDDGNVYFVDTTSNVVRRIDTNGFINTIAGTGTRGFSGDCGPGSAAQLKNPVLVAVHDRIVYIVDYGNARIRMIVP